MLSHRKSLTACVRSAERDKERRAGNPKALSEIGDVIGEDLSKQGQRMWRGCRGPV